MNVIKSWSVGMGAMALVAGCTPTISDLVVPVPDSLDGKRTEERANYLVCLVDQSLLKDDQKSDPDEMASVIANACSDRYAAWIETVQNFDDEDRIENVGERPALKTNHETALIMLLQTRDALSQLSPANRRIIVRSVQNH